MKIVEERAYGKLLDYIDELEAMEAMEEKNIKSKNSSPKKIAAKWTLIIVATYIPVALIIECMLTILTKTNFYGVYYQVLGIELLYMPGFLLFLIGFIINELIYFYKCKRYKNVINLIIIVLLIGGITYKFIPYSETYKDYKDLNYVTEGTYCEDVQDLKSVYVNEIKGKWSTKSLYVETLCYKFNVGNNIADESDYDSFKLKYNDVKKVRIKYLPNSEILLSIDPVND